MLGLLMGIGSLAAACGDDPVSRSGDTTATSTTDTATTSVTDTATSVTDTGTTSVTDTGTTSVTDTGTTSTDTGTTSTDTGTTSVTDTATSDDTSEDVAATDTTESDTVVEDTAVADTSVGDTGTTDVGADTATGTCDQAVLTSPLAYDGLFDVYAFGIGGDIDLGLGGPGPDSLVFERYSDAVGTIALGSGANANYETCEQCLIAYVDLDELGVETRILFASSGSVTLPDVTGGPFSLALADVRMVEVTLDGIVSTPVAGGACADLPDGTHTVAAAECVTWDDMPTTLEAIPEISLYGINLDDDVDLGFGGLGPDYLEFDFYSSATGTFDLGSGANTSYATCDQCVTLYVDVDEEFEPAMMMFQREGDLIVGAAPGSAAMTLTLDGIVLEEVVLDDEGGSLPVEGGACVELEDAVMSTP